MPELSEADLKAIAERFQLPAPVARIRPLGNGNVNRTYLVELDFAEVAAPSRDTVLNTSRHIPQNAPQNAPQLR